MVPEFIVCLKACELKKKTCDNYIYATDKYVFNFFILKFFLRSF